VKKTQEEELVYKVHFIKKKLGFSGSGRWNATAPPNPNFFT